MTCPDQIFADALKLSLAYFPDTGRFEWLERPIDHFSNERIWKIWNGKHAGEEAFPEGKNTYRQTIFGGRTVKAHQAAWLIFYGVWPVGMIDHINGNPKDNRIANLRLTDAQGNARNRRKNSNNTTGHAGVILNKSGRYEAWISNQYLAVFDTAEQAVAHRAGYLLAEGYHENHGR